MPEVTPHWKQGPKPKKPKALTQREMSKWRKEVMRRSKYRCAICYLWGPERANQVLAAHHVIFRSHCIPQYHVDPANGVALCHNCHRALHNGDVKLPMANLRPETIMLCRDLGLRWAPDGPEGTLSKYFS